MKRDGMLSSSLRLLIMGVALVSAAAAAQEDHDVLFQVSTIDAVLQSIYDGVLPYTEVEKHGDFGIGIFEGIDGEMVALDGAFYQVKADGRAYPVGENMTAPFATVTFFETDSRITLGPTGNITEFSGAMDGGLASNNLSRNLFYAIRIDGQFPYVKVRSVPRQAKPYPRLVDACANQSVFELRDVQGTVVGFFTPVFAGSLNVPGYHLHFITKDRKAGGHILDFSSKGAEVKVDVTPGFAMLLPTSGDFTTVDLTKNLKGELERIEK